MNDDEVSVETIGLLNELLSDSEVGLDAFRELDAYFSASGELEERVDLMYRALTLLEDDNERLEHFQTLSDLILERMDRVNKGLGAGSSAHIDPNDSVRLDTATDWSETLSLTTAPAETSSRWSCRLTSTQSQRLEYLETARSSCLRITGHT